jgi:dTDP-4-amino-4,6-dideoxy-D-galactose acyltransferase
MMMPISQLLDWDSEIFGFQVAKILPERLTPTELWQTLKQLASEGVRLVYWSSDSSDLASQTAAEMHQGFLADRKTTYLISFPIPIPTALLSNDIERYTAPLPEPELKQLALEIGLCSRFRADPRITDAQIEKIYHQWISNSVKTTDPIAERVLVIRQDAHIAGFVSLGEKQGRGDIGLLAVAEAYRGQQLGKKLVYAALDVFMQQGYKQSQVVTQGTNLPACRLYEACGYQVEKIENFYHFWL